jgi:hypothetical protein
MCVSKRFLILFSEENRLGHVTRDLALESISKTGWGLSIPGLLTPHIPQISGTFHGAGDTGS